MKTLGESHHNSFPSASRPKSSLFLCFVGLLFIFRGLMGAPAPLLASLAISDRILQLEPRHDLAMTCKGWALMRMKRYVEAESVLQQAGLDVSLVAADRGRFARNIKLVNAEYRNIERQQRASEETARLVSSDQ